MSLFSESAQCSVCTLGQLGQNSATDLGLLLELLAVAISCSLVTHALRTALISR